MTTYYLLKYIEVLTKTLWSSAVIALVVSVIIVAGFLALDIWLSQSTVWKHQSNYSKVFTDFSLWFVVTDNTLLVVFLGSFLIIGGLRFSTTAPQRIAMIPTPTYTPSPTSTYTPHPTPLPPPFTPHPTSTKMSTPSLSPTSTLVPPTPIVIKPTSTPVPPTPTSRPKPTLTPTRKPPTRKPPTSTPKPTATPTPIPVSIPACSQSVTGQFKNLWNKYRKELGCPHQARELGADTVYFVEQWFGNGHMFFFSSDPVHFVIAKYGTVEGGQPGTGTWQSFSSESWSGKDENFCNEGNGLDSPIYDNFNRVWCFEPGVRDKIGYPRDIDSRLRARLYGANNAQHVLAQGFDNGFILRDSDGVKNRLVYIFLYEEGSTNKGIYVRDYY